MILKKGGLQMKKTGLVLGGGGAKGSYEIGVWMALRDLKIEPEIGGVSGTSIGALNMALYAQNDIELAKTLWMNLSTKDIIHYDLKKIISVFTATLIAISNPEKAGYLAQRLKPEMIFQTGIFLQSTVEQIIAHYVNPLKLLLSPMDLFACCYQIKNLKAEYFPLRLQLQVPITSILLASAAIPGAFEAVNLNGYKYYDGGIADNVPIRPLYDIGYRKLIVVNLEPSKKIKKKDFPEAELYIITPQQPELFQRGLGNVLDFNPEINYLRICSGYQDTITYLADFPL